MSDSHDKLPKLFWIQLALAAAIGIMYLVTPAKHGSEHSAETTDDKVKTVSKNLAPVGAVATEETKASGSTKARSGEEVYKASCLACHATGIANAPKPDDKAAWEPRVATGLDALIKTAINGKGAMPARGGNPAVTDEEIKAAILYMTDEAGFNLGSTKAPEMPAAVSDAIEKAPEPSPQKMPEAVTTAIAAVSAPNAPSAPAAPTAPQDTKEKSPEAADKTVVVDDGEGEKVYKSACFACHDAGVAGSPKIADKEAWTARIALGNEILYTSAINGKGVMPPKGGNTSLSDDAVKAAVNYMIIQSQ
ncbi:MAG: c-type cytochrome [Cocleimonas sp.]|nr:c-type cytochrome [Cocleimonas sp.]